jgi:hypothetical protein
MRLFVATFAAGAIAGALAIGVAAIPDRAVAQGVPSYGRPATSTGEETIHGRIEAIEGPFAIVVRDDRGFLDSVALRQGTIINPRGLRLAVGMTVTIVGFNAGSSFSAVEIDAPYSYDESGASNYDAYGYGYDYGLASAYDLGLGLFGAFGGQAVQPVAPVAPPPGVTRGIEHPTPGHPIRRPLDDQAGAAPNTQASPAPSAQAGAAPSVSLPSYAVPRTAAPQQFGAGSRAAFGFHDRGGATPQSRAPSPESRGSAPEYHPAPPPARSEPARSEPARSEPARSEPARSEPARSEPTRSH